MYFFCLHIIDFINGTANSNIEGQNRREIPIRMLYDSEVSPSGQLRSGEDAAERNSAGEGKIQKIFDMLEID